MKSIAVVTVALAASLMLSTADADVWKWIDANGDTHFVDTKKPIFTWLDDRGVVHYSDSPDHEDAVSVELVWYSSGTLEELAEDKSGSGDPVHPGETEADRLEREQAERYYCKRATEIYDSYKNAPRLYRTNDNGEREYLSSEQAVAMLAETRQRRDELCEGL